MSVWRIGERELTFERPLAAGIVNVNDNSFFSGARSVTAEQAIVDGLALVEAGFDIVDVGAVAARSGPPVAAKEEGDRVVPAVEGLVAQTQAPISVDTFSTEVARRAVEAGACIVNDISGGRDPALFDLAAQTGCGLVLMHIEGPPRVDRPVPVYEDVVEHLKRFFVERIETAMARGVAEEQIALDPGFDFDIGVEDNLALLARLDELHALGRPLFVALSRKDFLGAVTAGSWEQRPAAQEREWATAAAVALAVAKGAQILRLHDARMIDVMRVVHAT